MNEGTGDASSGALDTIHGLIAARAAEAPDRIAVRDGARGLTYAQLRERAVRVARRLVAAGVVKGDRVGVYLDRSVDLVTGVIGVLEAGAAYVPLDPDFPAGRIELMVEDAGARVLVTERALAGRAPAGVHVLVDDEAQDAAARVELPRVTGDDVAYVIYTSGSTGRPKGVRIAHRSVANLLTSMAREPGITSDDVWLAITTLSFDISVLELFGPLAAGATTVVASREEVLDGRMLAAALERVGATIIQATPVAWRMLREAGWDGGAHLVALCGGEALPADLAADLAPRVASLWNMYGPTETTIWSTCYRVPQSGSPILIGRPVAQTSVYVLDPMMRPLPPGIPGEIWIGGAGVALGYHERPELTSERFVPDPFAGVAGARMYRTGDHGRYLRDGNLEFRSRVDNQVKIRGFRVELGEIEAAMVATESARQAAVVVHRAGRGDDRLVAFLAGATSGWTPESVRAGLRERLPEYMVPQHFLELDALPVTPNGKIDRKALESRVGELPRVESVYVAPRTEAERMVAESFADILAVERPGAHADFFDLGGHSVLAMRVIARLRDRGAVALSLRDIFEAPTVEALAARVVAALPATADRSSEEREVLVF